MISELPLPEIDEYTKEYWAGCKRHELLAQRCKDCSRLRFPPRPMCPDCSSWNAEWTKLSGKGRIFSWTVCHPPVLKAFEEKAPYHVVLVEMEEGTRLISNMVDCANDEIEMNMPVEVVFEEVAEDVSLPRFKRAGR